MAQSARPSAPSVTEKTFSSYNQEQGKSYAQLRPDYHSSVYQAIIANHASTGGQFGTLLDVGSGPGNAARSLGPHFAHAIGLDPSKGMVQTARFLGGVTSTSEPIRFEVSAAEELGQHLSPAIPDSSVDLITAANAAHWFDMSRFWPRAARVLKPGGSVALWASGEIRVHPSTPNAAAIQTVIDLYREQHLSPYFAPGNLVVRGRYVDLPLPWTLATPVPDFDEASFIRKDWDVGDQFYVGPPELDLDTYERVMGTASPIVRWREAHPDAVGTERDVLRMLRREMERLLHEAGVAKGEERLKGVTPGVVLIVKKKA
ncbi:MAG: hypothetical protein M1819_005515 [Sarea resinae]|nr:MAG: hypothetical protein M1819_005515 [Sarea resinae]